MGFNATCGACSRKRARQLRGQRDEWEEFEAKEKEQQRLEQELRHKREVERRMHPRTHEDFEVLFTELDAWRRNETLHPQLVVVRVEKVSLIAFSSLFTFFMRLIEIGQGYCFVGFLSFYIISFLRRLHYH